MPKTTPVNRITVGWQYFRDLYFKKKTLYPTTYFLFPTFTSKQKIELPKQMHKEIMNSFFDAYFEEFYYYDTPKYFPLSGRLIKGRGKPVPRPDGIIGIGVNWTWYERPAIQYFANLMIFKLKGGGRKVGKLDKKYKLNNDIGVLELAKVQIRRLNELNKLFKDD
jgi:hypothetical protein